MTSWAVAHQAPLSMGFHRQEYWSGLPFPPSEDLPDLGIEPASLDWQAYFFFLPLSHLGNPKKVVGRKETCKMKAFVLSERF